MTLEADAAPAVSSTPGAPWYGDLRRFLPVAVGLVLAVVATKIYLQATHPFMEHDDWFYVFPVDSLTDNVVYERLLAEGRWGNYLWWIGPGHLFSPVAAAMFYELCFLALCARLAWRWAPGWWCAPTLVALAVSPMNLQLSFWPATLGLTTMIAAVAAFTLRWSARTRTRLVVWIALTVVLTFLTYPPMTVVMLVVLLVELVDRSLKELFWLVVLFGVAYGFSTLVVFTLNRIAFGTFGIEVRPWRNPNKLHGISDLGENLRRVADQGDHLVGAMTIPAAVGLLALIACVAVPATRTRGVRLLLIALVAWGLQSSGTVLTGVVTPNRSCGWIWLVLVLALAWLLSTVEAQVWFRASAGVGVTVTVLWGARYSWTGIDYNHDRLDVYNRVDRDLARWTHRLPDARIYLYGSEKDWENGVFTQEAEYLANVAFYRRGEVPSNCRPPGCSISLRPKVLEKVREHVRVFRSVHVIVVVPPSHYRDLAAFTR